MSIKYINLNALQDIFSEYYPNGVSPNGVSPNGVSLYTIISDNVFYIMADYVNMDKLRLMSHMTLMQNAEYAFLVHNNIVRFLKSRTPHSQLTQIFYECGWDGDFEVIA